MNSYMTNLMNDIINTCVYSVKTKQDILKYFQKVTLLYYEKIELDGNLNEICKIKNNVTTYLYNDEEMGAIRAYKDKKTLIEPESVSYYINEYGHRGKKTINDINSNTTLINGCSFSFGQGINEKDCFYNYMGFDDIVNMSQLGTSTDKIFRHLFLVLEHYTPKNVVCLLPPYTRFEKSVANEKDIKDGNYFFFDIQPNFINKDKVQNYDEMLKFYEVFNEVDFFNNIIKNVNLIDFICKIKNINLYIGSWHRETHDLISKLDLNAITLPAFPYLDKARDGIHPGPITNIQFGEDCKRIKLT